VAGGAGFVANGSGQMHWFCGYFKGCIRKSLIMNEAKDRTIP
jgi:hypothetical protein